MSKRERKTAFKLLLLLQRSAGGNHIVYAAELWKVGGFARLSTEIELTSGLSVGGSPKATEGGTGGSLLPLLLCSGSGLSSTGDLAEPAGTKCIALT